MLRISSAAFRHEGHIPVRHAAAACRGGENLSPALQWSGVPEGAGCLALVVHDPDAPRGSFTHWLAFDIPVARPGLAEGASGREDPSAFAQGRNDFGNDGYDGPCPPAGETHRYIFALYALDVPRLGLGEGATAKQVRRAMQGHVLGQAELIGTFGREHERAWHEHEPWRAGG